MDIGHDVTTGTSLPNSANCVSWRACETYQIRSDPSRGDMSHHVQLPTVVKVTACLGSSGGEWGLLVSQVRVLELPLHLLKE